MQASVFISATNADYQAARQVYQFLTERGVACFFCDESLLRVGESNYRDVVDRALRTAPQLVLVTSSREHAESEWVKYAWTRFGKAPDAGHRHRNVITVLCDGMAQGSLPGALRRYPAFIFPGQLDALCDRLTNPGVVVKTRGAPGMAPAAAGRLTLRILLSITVANVLILAAVVWLLQRHGVAALVNDVRKGNDFISRSVGGQPPSSLSGREHPAGRRGGNDHDHGTEQTGRGTTADRLAAREAATVNVWDTPAAGTHCIIDFGDGVRAEFSYIPPGTFVMGSPLNEAGRDGDEPQHSVTISKGFWMARHECTGELWDCAMRREPWRFKDRPKFPVDTVSWTEVADGSDSFLAAVNASHPLPGWRFALPTEAQWEYACRAGTSTAFSFGSVLDGTQANCDGNLPYGTTEPGPFRGRTSKAGSYPPNEWGLYDMHGNVWEWCADTYESKLEEAIDPLSQAGTLRVQRGGSWRFNAGLCRSASRQGVHADVGDDTLGFRLVIVPAP